MFSHRVASDYTTVTITECNFINNTVTQGTATYLVGLLVFDACMAYIIKCHFKMKSIKVTAGFMLSITENYLHINRTILDTNTCGVKLAFGHLYFIFATLMNSFILVDSTFLNNDLFSGILHVASRNIISNTHLMIDKCSFQERHAFPFSANFIRHINFQL